MTDRADEIARETVRSWDSASLARDIDRSFEDCLAAALRSYAREVLKPLEKLVEKWQDEAARGPVGTYRAVNEACANELAAAIGNLTKDQK